MASPSKRRLAVAGVVVAASVVPLFTCAASPPVQPSPVVVNVKQTAVGINVCHSGCVQNVHVQNISVVIVNQGAGRAAPPTPPAVKAQPRPAVTSARKVTPRAAPPPPPAQDPPPQTGPPAADPPPALPSRPGDSEALGPRDMHSQPIKKEAAPLNVAPSIDARAAAFSRPLPAAAVPRPSPSTPWIPVLAVVLVLWTSLFFVRRPAPANGLLVLDDGPVA